jgi:hypothetical protein
VDEVEKLIEQLKDEDEDVLEYTCKALGDIGDERAVLPLIKFIENSDSNEVYIYYAILALGQIGDERAIEPLIEMLKNSELGKQRQISAKALGEMCTEKSIEPLIEFLQSENEKERVLAFSGLYGNVKHGDEHYQKIAEICSDIARCSAESRGLFDLINRGVGIHPDGSTAWTERTIPIIEPIGRKVFYDPVLQEFFYIDENGNEINCDNSGRAI